MQVSTIKTKGLKKVTNNIHLKKSKESNPQACFTLSSHRQASSKIKLLKIGIASPRRQETQDKTQGSKI